MLKFITGGAKIPLTLWGVCVVCLTQRSLLTTRTTRVLLKELFVTCAMKFLLPNGIIHAAMLV